MFSRVPRFVPSSNRGFTLIEIMVVMVIIALLAGATTLVIGDNQQRRMLENEARRLVAIIGLTQDEAIFQNVEIGLRLEEEGYSFRGLDEASLSWIDLPQDFLKAREFPDWIELDLKGVSKEIELKKPDEDKASFYPQIMFFSTGESTPFEVTLRHKTDRDIKFTLITDGLNGVKLEGTDDE